MRFGDLKGKSVIGVVDARKVGTVEDLLVDNSFSKLVGLRIRPEGAGPGYLVADQDVRAIGVDAVTISGYDALLPPERPGDLAGRLALGSVLGSKIVTEAGDLLGTVDEIELDPQSRLVQCLVYSHGALGGLFGRQRSVETRDIIGVGPRIVTVRVPAGEQRIPD